jgi:hypothetical protein
MADNGPLDRKKLEQLRNQLSAEIAAKSASLAADTARMAEMEKQLADAAELEELKRLAAKHNLVVLPADAAPSLPELQPTARDVETNAFPWQSVPTRAGPTIGDLVQQYRTDPRARYASLRFKTREQYEYLLRPIVKDCGSLKLVDLNTQGFQRIWDDWTKNGTERLPMGNSLMTMMRGLVNYGVSVLADPECERLSIVLHLMKFPLGKMKRPPLTIKHATAIMNKAHEIGKPSIALGQAFLFDCEDLSQKDVIGEWVPNSEPGVSGVLDEDLKWVRGLRWEEIDQRWILTHVKSRANSEVEIDLKKEPVVVLELNRILGRFHANPLIPDRTDFPASGPVLLNERTKLPWHSQEFRRYWRKIANECGVPKGIKATSAVSRDDEDDDEKVSAAYLR